MRTVVIIAIDGPAGSGKSSTAREVARRLGFLHLDSGAWYRGLTLAALKAGAPQGEWADLTPEAIDALGVSASMGSDGLRIAIDGGDVPDAVLRDPAVTGAVSAMASVPAVRSWLLDRQREAARNGDVVVDGRDIGTVVFPGADLKVYLDARPEVRATRRLRERGVDDPSAAEVSAEAKRLLARDATDASRPIAPLRRAVDAVTVDTSDLGFEDQVQVIVDLARARRRS